METQITLKLTVAEFDFIRDSLLERRKVLAEQIRTTRGVGTVELRTEHKKVSEFIAELNASRGRS